MAPNPAPMNGQIDSIRAVCSSSCAQTADPDFCFNACFKFQQALLQPVPSGPVDGSAGSASTTYPAWSSQNGAQSSYTATTAKTSTSTQYIAQVTGVSSSSTSTYSDPYLYISGTASTSSSTTTATIAADTVDPQPPGHPRMPSWLIALSVIIPILCVVFLITAIISIIRLRRTHKALKQARADAEAPEMKQLVAEMMEHREDAYVRPPSPQPLANPFDDPQDFAAGPSTSSRPDMGRSHSDTNLLPSLTTRLSQPVILSSTMDGAYFTGLDTADASSLHNQSMNQERDIYPMHDEEPPPPYRPASVTSMSRDSSLRNSSSRTQATPLQRQLTNRIYSRCLTGPGGSQRPCDNVAGEAETGMRNPFEDPDSDEKRPLTEDVDEPSTSEPLSHQVSRLSRRFSLDGDARSIISEPSWMQDDHPDRDEL